MYQVATPPGMGQTSTAPIVLAAPPTRRVVVGPRRIWAQGPGGRWWARPRRGISGCGGCGCAGMGQATLSNVGTDVWNALTDVFTNADGSLNLPAVGFAGFGAILIYVNWGNTTKKRFKK